jgi:hypothetical protein
MTKPTLPFTQTREQAKKAIINLLKNADSFIKDASEKYEKKQLEHITIPITFAMEQLGQSKLIFLKLNSTQGDITFEKSDKMFDHQENIDRIKSELEISEDKEKWLDGVWRDAPFPIQDISHVVDQFRHLYEDEMKQHMSTGAADRLDSSFVVFQNDGETEINIALNKSFAETRIGAVKKLREKLQSEFESL